MRKPKIKSLLLLPLERGPGKSIQTNKTAPAIKPDTAPKAVAAVVPPVKPEVAATPVAPAPKTEPTIKPSTIAITNAAAATN